jgi:hypothetical protein
MRGTERLAPYGAIIGLAAALMIPALISPPMVHDSFWIDWVWADQFTAELRRGVIYPRWLPQSHDGLGAPVFYFYPPMAFWLTGLFGLLGASTYGSILLAFATALAGSGVAMFHWLKGWTERPLFGALLYMIAPYHLCQFYLRGAMAEFVAFAMVPLVALAMRRCAEGRSAVPLALAYAALIMTHLPAALLVSLLFVAPYALWLAREHPWPALVVRLGAGFALGLGLAAIYLVPALTLQELTAMAKLWSAPQFRPSAWNFFEPSMWIEVKAVKVVMAICIAWGVTAALLASIGPRRSPWGLYALLSLILISGAVPFLWSLPIIEKVQFPWRALMLVEFAGATAFALVSLRPAIATAAAGPALLMSGLMLNPGHPDGPELALLAARHPDVIEYLPLGATKEIEFKYTMRATAAARAQPAVRVVDGSTVLRRYFFPAWRARCGGEVRETFADPATKLISFTGRNCVLIWRRPIEEWSGMAISGASLVLLLLMIARLRVTASARASRAHLPSLEGRGRGWVAILQRADRGGEEPTPRPPPS